MSPEEMHIATPDDTSIVIVRRFVAPRRRVWDSMFIPEQMRRWMLPPPDWTMTTCECDAREGGALNLTFQDADAHSRVTLTGVFTEVVLHERIVHTETMTSAEGQTIGSLIETHEFAERDGVTNMRITQRYESKAARDEAIESGMAQGMEAGYQRLDALLA